MYIFKKQHELSSKKERKVKFTFKSLKPALNVKKKILTWSCIINRISCVGVTLVVST